MAGRGGREVMYYRNGFLIKTVSSLKKFRRNKQKYKKFLGVPNPEPFGRAYHKSNFVPFIFVFNEKNGKIIQV